MAVVKSHSSIRGLHVAEPWATHAAGRAGRPEEL